ncbi:MAG: hypothetical protein K2H46_02705 [Muribaculaceae bacterium]|nr:hypothetical protein [Muribaculaceae bacterium]
MVTRDAIRNLRPGNRLEVRCEDAADLDSSYQTIYQMRKEMGLSKDIMPISRFGPKTMVVVEYRKEASDG